MRKNDNLEFLTSVTKLLLSAFGICFTAVITLKVLVCGFKDFKSDLKQGILMVILLCLTMGGAYIAYNIREWWISRHK